ncbi:hypothetical protein FPCIR_9396 [Fusarium pseudocircinatum]|uniref:Uncharacterized protein n=1 Tax=Fusarium pseudocircinatum TaxID=56676 RepID=A0A8H5KXX8_9HYPO|nr:hypothetical protein FPCIR_9396 [Fusarium pseudocircinatum]
MPAPLTLIVKDLRSDMILRCPQFLSFMVDPLALTQSHSIQGMADELFSCRNAHDASITFVAAVYMLQYPDTYTRMLDFRHTALIKLRSSLLRPKLSEMSDDVLWALIISMTLLALSDLFGTGDADAAFSHCSALLQIIDHTNSRSTSRMMTRMPLLSRLAAETALFGTSTLAIFQRWPNCRMGLGQWQRLENLYRRDSDYAFQDINTSPLLRSHPDLFLILLKLIELSRVPESIERSDRLCIIERQLSILKQDNLQRYGCKEDIKTAGIWGMIWGNVISVLRIFLTSLQNPSYCSRSPLISKQVKAALPILKGIWVLQNDKSIAWQLPFAALDVGIIRNVGVLTLLLLVICAVEDMEDLDQVVRRLYQGKEFVSGDHFERLRKVTEIIRRRKANYNGTCSGNATEPFQTDIPTARYEQESHLRNWQRHQHLSIEQAGSVTEYRHSSSNIDDVKCDRNPRILNAEKHYTNTLSQDIDISVQIHDALLDEKQIGNVLLAVKGRVEAVWQIWEVKTKRDEIAELNKKNGGICAEYVKLEDEVAMVAARLAAKRCDAREWKILAHEEDWQGIFDEDLDKE